jgi:hypothetical protein
MTPRSPPLPDSLSSLDLDLNGASICHSICHSIQTYSRTQRETLPWSTPGAKTSGFLHGSSERDASIAQLRHTPPSKKGGKTPGFLESPSSVTAGGGHGKHHRDLRDIGSASFERNPLAKLKIEGKTSTYHEALSDYFESVALTAARAKGFDTSLISCGSGLQQQSRARKARDLVRCNYEIHFQSEVHEHNAFQSQAPCSLVARAVTSSRCNGLHGLAEESNDFVTFAERVRQGRVKLVCTRLSFAY